MSNHVTRILLALFVVTISFQSFGATQNKTELYGVMFYADWCGSCKTLDPKIETAKQQHQLNGQEVLFLKLDLTDNDTTNQANMLVKSLGLDESYAQYGDKTGFMLIIDADSKQVVTRLTKKLSSNDIAKRIKTALKQAKA